MVLTSLLDRGLRHHKFSVPSHLMCAFCVFPTKSQRNSESEQYLGRERRRRRTRKTRETGGSAQWI